MWIRRPCGVDLVYEVFDEDNSTDEDRYRVTGTTDRKLEETARIVKETAQQMKETDKRKG
jgi:hypothetical protein